MLKPIIEAYPVIGTKDEAERERLRPAGRSRELYQEALLGWHEIIKHADTIGYWGANAIEHHFHSEGFEMCPAPGVINAYWAAITKNLHIGQLGYVLGTQNPIRVAEETAVLDHLLKGRFFVGLARGYQSRWTGTVGQHFGARPTKSPSAALGNPGVEAVGNSSSDGSKKDLDDDARNRAIFEEHVEILLKAWTQESFRHKGPNWQIPFPYETGIDDWPLAKTGVTHRMGAPREADANGNVMEISVVPAPYQRPHPPVFVSGSGSPETIEFAAKKGFGPVYFCNAKTAGPLAQRYVDVAAQHGRQVPLGKNQAFVRWVYIGKTDEEAVKFVHKYDHDIWKNLYGALGRRASSGDPVDSALASGLISAGSVDTVRKELMEQWKAVPAEHIVMIYHYANVPLDFVLENMELFIKHIKPDLDELIHKAY